MRILLALLFFVPSLCLAQSVTSPYNPDANADSAISVPDLLEFLPLFGGYFAPDEVTIEGQTLTEYVASMEEAAETSYTMDSIANWLAGLSSQYEDLLQAHVTLQAEFELLRGILDAQSNGDGTITFTFTDGTIFTTDDLTGPPGADGQNGINGANGQNGSDGVGILSVVGNGDGTMSIQLSDGTTHNLTIIGFGCTDPSYIEFDSVAIFDDGSCATEAVLGCTDDKACNYAPNATNEDGSCYFGCLGCTDTTACNYDADATMDDGSCVGGELQTFAMELLTDQYPYETHWWLTDAAGDVVMLGSGYGGSNTTHTEAEQLCSGCYTLTVMDTYGDGICCSYGNGSYNFTINGEVVASGGSFTNFDVTDFCEPSTIEGCTDQDYIEYNASANTDDGSCSVPIIPGCTDPDYMEYDTEANTDDGSCQCLIVDPACVSPTMDGHSYDVIQIGCQCWFAENLSTTVYSNGDVIPSGLTFVEWLSTTADASAVYGEGMGHCYDFSPDIDACDDAQSLAEYGRLYNWYAVDDARGLCPTGWHVPTDEEWTDLANYITSQGFAGTESTALKSTTGWSNNVTGTDDFGFSALPGGYRGCEVGFFHSAGYSGHWWSSSIATSSMSGCANSSCTAWSRSLYSNIPDLEIFFRGSAHQQKGYSVRCLKDAD